MPGGDLLPEPLLGVVAACDGLIPFTLGLLTGSVPGRQFILHRPEGLPDGLGLGFRSMDCLDVRHALVTQLGLEVSDCRLRLLEQLLRPLANGDLLPECLSCRFEHVDTGSVIVGPPNDGDRNLAITNEATRWTVCPGS